MLLDNVIAERRVRQLTGVTVQPESVAIGHYVGVLAKEKGALRDQVSAALVAAMRDGSLEQILRKWRVWNDDQPALYAKLREGEPGSRRIRSRRRRPRSSRRAGR